MIHMLFLVSPGSSRTNSMFFLVVAFVLSQVLNPLAIRGPWRVECFDDTESSVGTMSDGFLVLPAYWSWAALMVKESAKNQSFVNPQYDLLRRCPGSCNRQYCVASSKDTLSCNVQLLGGCSVILTNDDKLRYKGFEAFILRKPKLSCLPCVSTVSQPP